jgi:uncharacterized membrane protein YphA (DoxX/SURF4 family)/thiol-disulfide isomerase/thioredoxin
MISTVNGVLLSARCLLAAVFLVAAVGKLFDLAGARNALEQFGVAPPLARLGAPALPVAEIVVAVALVLRPSAIWGASGALLLLLVFAGGIARAMSQGRAPDCHCFGQIHSEPAGPSTLVRNLVLAALAVVILAGGSGPSLNGAFRSLDGTQDALVATSCFAAILLFAVGQLLSDRRRLRRDLDTAIAAQAPPGLPRGTPAPNIGLMPVQGGVGTLGELFASPRSTVLVFVSVNCPPCLELLPSLARWQESLAESVALPVLFSGDRDEIERLSDQEGLRLVLAQEANEAFDLYSLRATPSAVLIDADRNVGGAPAEGAAAIEALIRSVIAGLPPVELAVPFQ